MITQEDIKKLEKKMAQYEKELNQYKKNIVVLHKRVANIELENRRLKSVVHQQKLDIAHLSQKS